MFSLPKDIYQKQYTYKRLVCPFICSPLDVVIVGIEICIQKLLPIPPEALITCHIGYKTLN
jgi:hypothetical protein